MSAAAPKKAVLQVSIDKVPGFDSWFAYERKGLSEEGKIVRLEGSAFAEKIPAWIQSAVHNLCEVSVQAYGSESAKSSSVTVQIIKECGGTLIVLMIITTVLDCRIEEDVVLIKKVQNAFMKLGEYLSIHETMPTLELTGPEREWIDSMGTEKKAKGRVYIKEVDKSPSALVRAMLD